jgi:prepilin-type N-terminal cleavage/methylation domain-containing protein
MSISSSTGARRKSADPISGFTLVELLVVIAIIGILVALLLPAIQAAREAARRAQCQNNLKNIALALQNYHTANKRFPPGFVSTGSGAIEAWAWSTFALPYLEEQAIYDQLRPSETFLEPVLATRAGKRNLADVFAAAASNPNELVPLQTPLSVFRCPSDNTPALIPVGDPVDPLGKRSVDDESWERHFNGLYAPKGFQPSTSNYVGSKGLINSSCTGAVISGRWQPDQNRCNNNGIFFGNSEVAIKRITDGTSKTFLIGERDKFCLAATWIGVRNPPGPDMWSSNWALAHVFRPLNEPFTGAHNTCTEGFSSAHPGGAFFAFCDGSVHFINDDISFDGIGNSQQCYYTPPASSLPCIAQTSSAVIGVYQRLGWRNDEVVIDDTDF